MKNGKKYDRRNSNKPMKGGEISGEDSKFARIQPVQAQHLEVKVYDNFDKAFKAFRTLVQKEGILSSYKEKQSFEKPSDKKRRKRNEMRRKRFELENKNSDFSDKRKKRKLKEFDDVMDAE